MIDIHSHILPGMDDGAKTIEDSVAMIRVAAADGITDIVASPHSNVEYVFDPGKVREAVAQVREATGNLVRIHTGCDFHLQYDSIQDAIQNPTKYTINGKSYLLVEFSELVISRTSQELFYRLLSAGMIPIVTHPERNMLLQQRLDQIKNWVNNGVLMQVTAQSFLGRFGRRAKRFADELVNNGLVHFVASDAHDAEYRPPRMKEAREYVAGRWGAALADRLCVTNPRAAIEGLDIELQEMDAAPARKWYQFWR